MDHGLIDLGGTRFGTVTIRLRRQGVNAVFFFRSPMPVPVSRMSLSEQCVTMSP